MDDTIQLLHPQAKKAVRMAKEKYRPVKDGILAILTTNNELTHTELLRLLEQHFKKQKIVFQGSLQWYMEWVKLDLLARNVLRQNKEKTPVTLSLV